jgi:hypothetical protein
MHTRPVASSPSEAVYVHSACRAGMVAATKRAAWHVRILLLVSQQSPDCLACVYSTLQPSAVTRGGLASYACTPVGRAGCVVKQQPTGGSLHVCTPAQVSSPPGEGHCQEHAAYLAQIYGGGKPAVTERAAWHVCIPACMVWCGSQQSPKRA